jgi:hypothetical protein
VSKVVLSLVVTLLALIAASSLASAQVPPCTTLSGSAFSYCVSDTGNVVQMETPLGTQHLSTVSPEEGYGVCDVETGVRYFDYNDGAHNWQNHATVLSTSPLSIGRTTSDGLWQLVETFTTSKSDSSIKIKMELINQAAINKRALLVRYANVNVNGSSSDFLLATTVSADAIDTADPPASPGMQLRDVKGAGPNVLPLVQKVSTGPDPCAPTANSGNPFVLTDGSLELVYAATVPKNGSKTFTALYRPF